ncbi:MAG TPA: HTTM domain-containing protein [Flavobacteriales bacterium]|nr:HTTM domain-containing protein [Flavobacteriales bacterium]
MSVPQGPVRLFRLAVHAWLILDILASLPAAEWIWDRPISSYLPGPPGPFRYLTHAFSSWLPGSLALPAVGVLLLLSVRGLFRPSRWWSALLVWGLFTSLLNHAWLVGTGGHQLMANVLFWMIFLPDGQANDRPSAKTPGGMREVIGRTAFWIIRLQLLVAYGATGVQKLTGYQWTHGHAIGIVSTDPDYGPAFLAGQGILLVILNYAVLGFQLTFPLAVWWRRTRIIWMWSGLVFHIGTGVAFGILDMGLAFLAVYPIWWGDAKATKVLRSMYPVRSPQGS